MFSKSTVKYIQSLQHKKFRDESNAFVAEGPKLVTELLGTDIFNCLHIYALREWGESLDPHLKNRIISKLFFVKDFELEKLTGLVKANMVVAVFEKKKVETPDLSNKITLALDDIQDPGNLGTIIRIADWFGVKNILCSPQTADMYNSKVVQSTMASLGRVNLVYGDLYETLQKTSVKKYATALNGTSLEKVGKLKEGIIIIGNESKGISKPVMEMAEEKITIARIGEAESLNAGVATGIVLYGIVSCW